MLLLDRAVSLDIGVRLGRWCQDLGQIQVLQLPVVDRIIVFQDFAVTNHLVDRAESKRSHDFASFFRHHEQVVDDVFRFPGEHLSKFNVLRRHADRAGIQMAFSHHDAAKSDQRRGRESEFLSTKKASDNDVTACLQLAIRFQANSTAQVIQHKRLMGFRDSQFPRHSRMLDTGQR